MPEDFQDTAPPQTDPIDKLYNTLVNKGYYTKSFDEFKVKYSTPENIDKLYSVVNRDGLYTKSKDEFNSQYFSSSKKKDFDTNPHSYLNLFGKKLGPSGNISSPTQLQSQEETNNLPSTSTVKLGATDARVSGYDTNAERIASPKSLGKALVLGAGSGLSGTLKAIGKAAKDIDLFGEYKGHKAEELATYRAGKWIDEQVKDLVGELSPEEQNNFSVKLASNFGQMGTLMLGGVGSRALGMSEGLTAGFMGAAMQGSAEYENAVAAGATPDQASKAFWINTAIGSSQSIPVMGAFRKLDKYTGGLATGTLAKELASTVGGRLTADMAQGAITNAATMAGQTILTNITAKNTYDETRKVFDGLGESLGMGSIVGGVLHGMTSAIREKRMAGNLTPEESASLDKAEDFANKKINEVEAADRKAKVIVNHAEKVKENVSHLPEKQQDEFVKQSLREKVANENAEKLTDPTLIKQEKEKAKEAHEIKEQLLAGKNPDEIVTEAQQKKIDEQNDAKDKIEYLKKQHEIDLKKWKAKRDKVDGREGDESKAKIEELNLEKEQLIKEHQKKVAEQEAKLPKEEKVTPSEKVTPTDDITKATEAAKTDIKDEVYRNAFTENPEQSLKEIAQQLNSSKDEADATRRMFGDKISDIALKLYPQEKVAPQDVSGKSGEEKVATKEEFNDAALNLATLDLEDSQVRYPKVEGRKQTMVGSGNDYNLYLLDREKMPESGPFEISIQDDNGESIGFIRGTKSDKTISINLIHLQEENRGKGIGTDIYEKLLNDGYTIKSDKEITDDTYSLYDRLGSNEDYERLVYNDGRIGVRKKSTAQQQAPKEQLPEATEQKTQEIKQRYLDDFNVVEDSKFDWRVKSELSSADRKKAVADIKAGKETAATKKLNKEMDEAIERGTVIINRGRGTQAETVEIPIDDWFGFTQKEQDQLVKSMDKLDENSISIINENNITLDNIDSLKHLFDGFPYDQTDFQAIKDYLSKSSSSDKTRQVSEASKEKVTEETEVGKPPTEPPSGEPPVEPPKSEPPPSEEKGGGKDKGILNRLHDAKNVPEASKKGFEEKGLKYEPQSREESEQLAKAVVDEFGIDEAVTMAEANRLRGGVRSAVFAESLTRLSEAEEKAKTPQEKLDAATKFAEIGIRYDEFSREQGRDIAQIDYFYKKSPLGVQIRENIRRKEEFDEWSKPKEKSWKEFLDELKKEPEFEKLFKEEVKEELKKERATARKERIRKVDEWFDQAKKDVEGKGGATYATIIPPKIMKLALDGMQKAYHAGEVVAELIQNAIDEISAAMGNAPWDKEKFRKEWEEKLKEKLPKEKLSDEELKAKVLDKFRRKLKGLTEKQKDDVIRKSHKHLIDNGALEFDEFKDIIARVVGKGELTPEEAARMKELVKITNSLEEAGKKMREERTPEAIKNYEDQQKKTAQAARELNDMFYNKPDILRRLTGIMQLNTLGIVSLINNPVYNIVNQLGVRFPVGALNDIADRVISGVTKHYEREYNVFETQKDFWNMVGVGAKEAGEQMLTGLNRSDYTQKELHSEQIRPFKALRDLNAWRKGEKQLSKRQVVDKMLQGTAGIPAEIVARMLNIGDKPQRFAAGGAQAAAFAKSLGLKEVDKKIFMEFPREEAYRAYKKQGLSDDKAAEKADYIKEVIEKEAQRSTFQQENLLNDLITAAAGKLFGGKDTGAASLAKTLAISPYIKIPTNAFWSMYNLLNPEVALLQATVHGARSGIAAKKGETNRSKLQLREARYWAAHAIVGMATRAAIIALTARGAFVPPTDEDDPKKEREAVNQFSKQGTTKIGNLTISNRWFGQWGMLANQISKKYQDMTPEQKENSEDLMNIMIGGMEKEGLRELENGVFSNSASIIESVYGRGGNVGERYLMNTLNLFTNIIQPGTLAQHSRAQLDYVPSSKGDSFLEKVDQNFAQRSQLYRSLFDKNIKYKRDMWGEKMPRGGNTLSRMFGISQENPQQFARPLYNDYLRTNDTGFFPPAVADNLNGKKLTTAQYEKLSEQIGQERKRMVEPYVNDMALVHGFDVTYSQLNDEDRKYVLNYLYTEGREKGLEKFYQDYPDLKPKEEQPDYLKEAKKDVFKVLSKYGVAPKKVE